MSQARQLGLDAEAYRRERDPRRMVEWAAEIAAAERKRADEREDQAARTIAALGRGLRR